MESETLKAAARHWDNVKGNPFRHRFWLVPGCIRAINRRMDVQSSVWSAGLIAKLKMRPQAAMGISIGCGAGGKELRLIKEGIVGHFDLFEISEARISQGRSLFAEAGLSARATFRSGDGLAALNSGRYDLVFWDSSLHHMPDTREALRLSLRAVRPGGAVVINEYVGPNRFQWPDIELQAAARVRAALPDRFFDLRCGARLAVTRQVERPTLVAMTASDPTEAQDSEAILPAIREFAPDTKIWLLGGVIYHLGLSDVLANFRFPDDDPLLDMAMAADELLSLAGHNHFAACIIER